MFSHSDNTYSYISINIIRASKLSINLILECNNPIKCLVYSPSGAQLRASRGDSLLVQESVALVVVIELPRCRLVINGTATVDATRDRDIEPISSSLIKLYCQWFLSIDFIDLSTQ